MKKRIALIALALGVAGAPAFAQPTKMTEAQLDRVAGGLADVSVSLDNVANPTITVNPTITANPSVSVSVLGG